MCGGRGDGAQLFVAANPDAEPIWCCYGETLDGVERCTCWRPVFDVEQAPPRRSEQLTQDSMCSDCAFRPGSPERSDEYTAEALYQSALSGEPFYCHDGMRRPVAYRHPQRGDIPAPEDDWKPAEAGGVPYRADGTRALICAGWAAVSARRGARTR